MVMEAEISLVLVLLFNDIHAVSSPLISAEVVEFTLDVLLRRLNGEVTFSAPFPRACLAQA